MAGLPSFEQGPHPEVVASLRALASGGAALVVVLEAARSMLGEAVFVWTRISVFLRAFDLTLAQASALGDWDGWLESRSRKSLDELAHIVPTLAPRTSEMVDPDFGPDAVRHMARLLRSSPRPLWGGLRREIGARAQLALVGLAEAHRSEPGRYVFLGVVGDDVVLFTYAAPPQSLEEGRIEDWQLVAGTATAHRYQFALANARLVRDSQEAG